MVNEDYALRHDVVLSVFNIYFDFYSSIQPVDNYYLSKILGLLI